MAEQVRDLIDDIEDKVIEAAKGLSDEGNDSEALKVVDGAALLGDMRYLLGIAKAARNLRGQVIIRDSGEISPAKEGSFDYVAVQAVSFDNLDLAIDGPTEEVGNIDETVERHVMVRRQDVKVVCACGRLMTEGDFNGHMIEKQEQALEARRRRQRGGS